MSESYVPQGGSDDAVARAIMEKPRGQLSPDGYRQAGQPEAKPPGVEEPATPETPPQEAAPEESASEVGEQPDASEQPSAETDENDPLVVVPIGGKEQEIKLSELAKGYMLHADYTKKTMELSNERKDWETKRAQEALHEREAIQFVSGLAQQLQAEIQRSMPSQEQLAHLRQTDPGEYAAVMREIDRRSDLVAHVQRAAAESQQRQIQAAVPVERAKLIQLMPEDFKDFRAVYTDLGEWVTTPVDQGGGGLTREEWGQVIDHRLVYLAQLAKCEAKRRAGGAKATSETLPRIKQAVSTMPRVRAGGPPAIRTNAERNLVDARRAQAEHPDSIGHLAGLLLARERAKK